MKLHFSIEMKSQYPLILSCSALTVLQLRYCRPTVLTVLQ